MESHRSSPVARGAAWRAGWVFASRLSPGAVLSVLSLAVLAGCPTVDLGDTPTEIGLCNPAGGLAYFQDQIWPNYVIRPKATDTCARSSCHIAGGNGLDFPDPVDYPTAYRRVQAYLNCGTPEASLFLTKPLAGTEPHAGGDIIPNNPGNPDPTVTIFLDWFK